MELPSTRSRERLLAGFGVVPGNEREPLAAHRRFAHDPADRSRENRDALHESDRADVAALEKDHRGVGREIEWTALEALQGRLVVEHHEDLIGLVADLQPHRSVDTSVLD